MRMVQQQALGVLFPAHRVAQLDTDMKEQYSFSPSLENWLLPDDRAKAIVCHGSVVLPFFQH